MENNTALVPPNNSNATQSAGSFSPSLSSAPSSRHKNASTMWDAFEHILMFISLYVMATSIVLILYFFIDKWFPGVTEFRYNNFSTDTWRLSLLRGYLAALIVSYPFFAFFFLNTIKRTIYNPMLRTIKSRKILIYLTLVVAFVIMLIYVIQLVYKLLSGDVTVNFLLHLLALFSVIGTIFTFFILQVKEDRRINA